MRCDIHLDPDGLHAAAASLARVLGDLHPPLAAPADLPAELPDAAGLQGDRDRLLTSVARATAELASLHAALRNAAAAAEHADLGLACDLRRLASEP